MLMIFFLMLMSNTREILARLLIYARLLYQAPESQRAGHRALKSSLCALTSDENSQIHGKSVS